MNNLIGKTIAITLAAVLVALLVTFGAMALFAPKILGGIFGDLGAYSTSIHFYESQYSKTGDVKDLATLIDRIDMENDSEKAEQYLYLMLNEDEFDQYCQSFNDEQRLIPLKDYYNGLYAEALVIGGKLDEALNFSNECVQSGYGEYNPYRAIIAIDNLTDEQLQAIRQSIINSASGLSGAQLALANSDIADIDTLING